MSTTKELSYDIADIGLAERGRFRMAWAAREMPVLDLLEERFRKEQPFKGIRMAAAMHVTSETAQPDARVDCGWGRSCPVCQQSTQHPRRRRRRLVAHYEMPVYAIKGETQRAV